MMFSDCDYSKAVQASYGSNDTHSFLPNAAAEVRILQLIRMLIRILIRFNSI